MDRAYSVLEIKAVDDDERVITGIASTPAPDRMDDIVEPMGAKFKLPMPLLWQHQADNPVGFVEFAEATEKGIPFTARLPIIEEDGDLKRMVDRAWQSVKAKLVRGVSIGFRALKDGIEIMDNGGYRFKKWEWLELSLVTIPANSQATIQTIKFIDTELRAATGHEQFAVTGSDEPSRPAPRAKHPIVNLSLKEKPKMQTYAEQISAFEAKRSANIARMDEITEAAKKEGRSKDESEREEFGNLRDEIKTIDEELVDLRDMERLNVSKAQPVNGESQEKATESRSGGVPAQVKAPAPEKGIRFARFARCIGLARKQGRDILTVADELYKDRDPEVTRIIKAAVGALNTGDDDSLIGNAGGFADFVELLREQTIVGRFGAAGVPGFRRIPFRVPLIIQETGSTGYWVGEGAGKPLTKPSWDRTELAPLKCANIAVATMELLRDSSPAAERLLRDDLAQAIAAAIDEAFIDPANAGTAGVKPASITNGLTAIPSGGGDAAGIREDVRGAMSAFVAANNRLSSGVWIMSSQSALALSLMRTALDQPEFAGVTVNGGSFFGLPVVVSEFVSGYVVLVNAADIWFADDGGVSVDMSTEASLQMDDAPTGNSVTPTVAQVVSMFQTNSVAFRAERTLNWARRRATAVALISGATWGEPEGD